jgi:hypothetical protein
MSLLLAVGTVAAQSAVAAGTPFQRGDVVASVNGGIDLHSPDGILKATFASGSGARGLCFDPNGRRLVAPGAGLFDSSGNALPSNWALLTRYLVSGGECTVDGSGHVYVPGPSGVDSVTGHLFGTIGKYDLAGNLLRSYTVGAVGPFTGFSYLVYGLDLSPDPCTIYYNAGGGSLTGRYNVCTNTQEPTSGVDLGRRDELRVLPNWDVGQVFDGAAWLFDPTESQAVQFWGPGVFGSGASFTRFISLDPDGTSLWVGSLAPVAVWRLDSVTGQVLASWGVTGCGNQSGCGVSGIAAYAPPLLGNADVKGAVDSNSAGSAEAFVTRAGYSGQMTRLHLWVDSSSTASQVVVGIYSNHNGNPGALQAQETITSLRAGSWNYVEMPSMPVTAGQPYWIAVLGPVGAGRIRFRDALSGAGSETSAQHNLTALPAKWSTGKTWATGKLSAYGS